MKTIKYLVPMQQFTLEVEDEEFDRLKDVAENASMEIDHELDWFVSDIDVAIDGPYFVEGE